MTLWHHALLSSLPKFAPNINRYFPGYPRLWRPGSVLGQGQQWKEARSHISTQQAVLDLAGCGTGQCNKGTLLGATTCLACLDPKFFTKWYRNLKQMTALQNTFLLWIWGCIIFNITYFFKKIKRPK